jgi:ribosomal protein L11 methyltransferase
VIRLAVRVRSERAELVLADLLELAPAGVEEVDVGDGTVEYAVYGAPGELPRLPDLRALAGAELVELSTSELQDDWQERWKRFHRSVLIQAPTSRPHGAPHPPSLLVRPSWETPTDHAGADVREIVIDPGQAFGTGAHATTRLCLELLLKLAARERSPGALLDVGAGSAVLAIAAARLGFAPVLALDNDRESVRAARENAAVNDVSIDVRRFDLRAETLPWTMSDRPAGSLHVIANLLRPLLLELAGRMRAAPTSLIAGGLLREEADEVADAFAAHGLGERERRASGEWAALWLSAEA